MAVPFLILATLEEGRTYSITVNEIGPSGEGRGNFRGFTITYPGKSTSSNSRKSWILCLILELLECGLDSKTVTKKMDSVIAEIKSGKLDVIF